MEIITENHLGILYKIYGILCIAKMMYNTLVYMYGYVYN